ncbi:MAG: cyclase family protein [Oscillospiraceae bacterium]|nr:cyclase family protein [Oscillospiraceae bacterium]
MSANMNNAGGDIMTEGAFDALFESLKNWGRWGADDERGTLNYITPDAVKAAAALVTSGRSVSMSIPIDTEAGPDNAHPAIHYMAAAHDIDTEQGAQGFQGFATDFLGMQFHGDCHTHLDALCHISYKGLLYNGVPASVVSTAGAGRLDVTAYAHGVAGRGVLIDVPRHRGIKWMEPGDSVTAGEIEAIERAENVRLGQGDIMLLRTGQCRRRAELGPWNVGHDGEGRAGVDPYCVALMHERRVAAFLPEGDGETAPSRVQHLRSPIHVLQVAAMGMFVADSLQLDELAVVCEEEGRYEFMVVAAPLRLPGGTGSPFNPIALF